MEPGYTTCIPSLIPTTGTQGLFVPGIARWGERGTRGETSAAHPRLPALPAERLTKRDSGLPRGLSQSLRYPHGALGAGIAGGVRGSVAHSEHRRHRRHKILDGPCIPYEKQVERR